MIEGHRQENKVIDCVKKLLENSNIEIVKSSSGEENVFDFKLITDSEEMLFEIYSPKRDFQIFCKKFKEQGVSIFGKQYLKFAIINKYYKQFKTNPDKFLIINLNNDGDFGTFNLNYRKGHVSRIAKIVSCSVMPDGYMGLFHNETLNIAKNTPPVTVESIEVNHLIKMKGIITFYDDEFIEFIINPYSNITKKDVIVIKSIFNVAIITKNPAEVSENEKDIHVLSEENKYLEIFDNLIYKILRHNNTN